MLIRHILERLDYIVTVILFSIGLYALVVKTNLIKKLIGLNIMETSIYLFLIAIGDVRLGPHTSEWANPGVVEKSGRAMVNPIPSALTLTAIVVSVCVTAVALSVAVKLYQHYGTLDTREIANLKG